MNGNDDADGAFPYDLPESDDSELEFDQPAEEQGTWTIPPTRTLEAGL